MSAIQRRESMGLKSVLLLVFNFAFLNQPSSSNELCVNVNGEMLCYFKAGDSGVDWETAWQLCNSRNSTLPAIRNRNEQTAIEKFLTVQLSGSIGWTAGRIHKYKDWTWLDGRQVSENEHLFFTHVLSGERCNMSDGTIMVAGHTFLLKSPRGPHYYICQYPGNLCKCFSDTYNVTRGCIRYSEDRRSWYDARNQCLFSGGDLAVFDYLDLYAGRHKDNYFVHSCHWIGYRTESWRWNLNKNESEEDDAKYTNWSDDWDPLNTGDCISINASNGKWKAIGCSKKMKVVCQRVQPVTSVMTTEEPTDSKTLCAQVPENFSHQPVTSVMTTEEPTDSKTLSAQVPENFSHFAFLNHSSSSNELCASVNGQILCYFKARDSGVDWETAWQLCDSRNSTLPAIHNRNEQVAFEKFLTIQLSGSIGWTAGRIHRYNDWTWLDGRPFTVYENIYLFRSYSGELYFNESDIKIYEYHDLVFESPRDPHNYICQYPGNLCKYFNDTYNVTRGCIRYSEDKRSWYDARNQCIFGGGDLAIFDYADINSGPHGKEDLIHSRHWIGYATESWRWNLNKNASEEDDAKYTNWSDDWDPMNTGDCISINASNGKWKAIGCSEKMKVVCQRVQSVFSTMTTEPNYRTMLNTQIPETFAYIPKFALAVFLIIFSIVVVAVSVRCYMNRRAKVSLSTETQSTVAYQILRTTQRQTYPNDQYCDTEIQLLPEHEVVD